VNCAEITRIQARVQHVLDELDVSYPYGSRCYIE
jgi:hypothetical protein